MTSLPDPLAVGAGNAVLIRGEAGATPPRSARLGDGPTQQVEHAGADWWALLEVPADQALGLAELELEPAPPDAEPLARTTLRRDAQAGDATPADPGGDGPLVAICMATYEPDRARLAAQLDSIRAQTHGRWVCVISDDASSPEAASLIESQIADDPRFALSRAERNAGFYGNFERAMAMAPAAADLVQLADQDDVWREDKLERMIAVLDTNPEAVLAYSDMRVVDGEGAIVSDTFWYESDNASGDIGTLLIVNTVFGVASLFRRELLDAVLPLPPAFSDQHYHDHWVALCARATGEIVFLDEPTYDYVRHTESVTMSANTGWAPPAESPLRRLALALSRLVRRVRLALEPGAWRVAYLDRYLTIRQFATVLELRFGERMTPSQRRSVSFVRTAGSSPHAFVWLLLRTLRPLLGRRETLGRERVLAGAIVWRRLAGLRRR